MNITDAQAKNAKPQDTDYKIRDRDNMYLTVTKAGGKYWRLDYRFENKRKTLTLGKYPDVSLKKAREKCSQAKSDLSEDIDPAIKKKVNKELNNPEYTFMNIGKEWHEVMLANKSDSHRSRSLRMLQKELFPHIGQRSLSDIQPTELLLVLRNIENRGVVDTAHRAKQTASQVFNYAISCGYCNNNPATQLAGALRPKNTTHYPSITDPAAVGKLMVAINEYNGSAVVRYALKMSALLFLRPGELRQLEWQFVDFEERHILIPERLMKIRMDHIVPLADQSLHILTQIKTLSGDSKYVFPSPRGNSRPLSDSALRIALRTMGYDKKTMVPHGFRAMARTLLDEKLEFNVVWIEQQLAHVVKDLNGRAYNRTKHLRQRYEMMQQWADYLDELKSR